MKDSDAVTHCSSKFLKIGKVDETGSIFFAEEKKHMQTMKLSSLQIFVAMCINLYQSYCEDWTMAEPTVFGKTLCQASSAPRSVPGRARMFRCSIVFHSFRFVKIL